MISIRYTAAVLMMAATALAYAPHAMAQNQNWFIPGQQRPAAPRPAVQRAAPRPAPPGPQAEGPGAPAGEQQEEIPPEQLQVQLPPSPPLPPLDKGTPPPQAIMGVIDVQSVLHASTAYQEVEKTIGARRQKLNEDAQAEQGAWRDLQQQLATQRSTLSAEQIRVKEKELQDRITEAQRKFRDRNRIIQEAIQYSLAQVDRALNQVVQQVALGRGMNLVLHRAQVALNMPDFDISDQVASQLNKMLPTVIIPPDGVAVSSIAPAATQASASGTPPPATPAITTAPPAPAPEPAPAKKPNHK